ncbi:Uncharacterised protein g10711 [Pycnogonum litorale]
MRYKMCHKFSLLILTVSYLLHTGLTIKCYVCNSYRDQGCSGVPRREYLQNCSQKSPKYDMCRTVEQNINVNYGDKNGNNRIIRLCAYEKYRKPCYRVLSSDGNVKTCTCNYDGCNIAHSSTPATYYSTLIMMSLIAFTI